MGDNIWDNPLGGFFDFNKDGKEDPAEQWLAFNIFQECTKTEEDTDSSSDGDFFENNWRLFCEDGSDFGVDPEDYDNEDEYNDALEKAKYAWRDTAEDGSEYGIFPFEFETEAEYAEALNEEKNAWRDTAEDGSAFGINPDDYNTANAYINALDEVKYSWRDTAEDGSEYGIFPYDYNTAEEYKEALSLAMDAWRDAAEDGSEFDIDPYDYNSEAEYNKALEKAKHAWRDAAEDGSKVGLDPVNYETEEEYNNALSEAAYGWRDAVEDGTEFDVFPEDYETQDAYEEALSEAAYGWRDTAEDGFEYGIDPEDYETEDEYECALACARAEEAEAEDAVFTRTDAYTDTGTNNDEDEITESAYPNKRQYEAAVILAGHSSSDLYVESQRMEIERCRFILEQNQNIIAANYLTAKGDFLFSQAVKDNFDLPVTLPDEDESSEFLFRDILKKVQRKDTALALKIWDWCAAQFLPYADYSRSDRDTLTNYVLDDLRYYSDDFYDAFRQYINTHADFRTKLIRESGSMPDRLGALISDMLKDGFTSAAEDMFNEGLYRSEGRWKDVDNLMNTLIYSAMNDEELETIEFVEFNFLPRMKEYSDGMILDEIEVWQKEITENKRQVEKYSDKYSYSRGNAWRKAVPDGDRYVLDPLRYDSEQEYLEALEKAKYAWRTKVNMRNTLGLDPLQFETEKEYRKEWDARFEEQQKIRDEKRRKALEAKLLKDRTIYTYCGVKLPFSERPYYFRTNDSELKIGDTVIVPVKADNTETEGYIVSIGQYARIGVPFPLEKTKFILRKTTKIPESK